MTGALYSKRGPAVNAPLIDGKNSNASGGISAVLVSVLLAGSFLAACNRIEMKKEYYANDVLKSETEVKNGLRNGRSTSYDSEGYVTSRQHFRNDTLHGESITFFRDGKRSGIVNYENGILNGEYLKFYSNGNIGGKGMYRNGRSVGLYYQYDPNDSGRVLREAYLINVRGKPMRYYIKRVGRDGKYEYEHRSVTVIIPENIALYDTVDINFYLPEETEKGKTAVIVIGDFDDDFRVKSRVDTLNVRDGHTSYRYIAREPGRQWVRGEVIYTSKEAYKDSTVTYATYEYFEEGIKVGKKPWTSGI